MVIDHTEDEEEKPPEDEEQPAGKIPDDVVEKGMERLHAVIKGNGLKKSSMTLDKCEGRVLEFQARNRFKIEPTISEKQTTGREQGEVCGSAADVKSRIQNEIETLGQNRDIKKYTIKQLKDRKDKGFGVPHQSIKLDKHKHRYVLHESCNICRGDGKIECKHCKGKGREVCNRCHGDRFMVCNMCRNTGVMNTANGQQQCTECRGEGRIPCRYCNQSGQQQCSMCKSTGQLGCQECNQSGWRSKVTAVQFKAVNSFEYDKENLPAEVIAVIDDLGPELISDNHAEAKIIEDISRDKEIDQKGRENEYVIAYDVSLPWGELFAKMKTMPVRGNIIGYQGELLFVTPFMERLTAKPLGDIHAMAASGHITQAKLKAISRFRIVREALFAAARLSPAKARAYMEDKYPFGFDPGKLEKTIAASDRILKLITKAPRQKGMIAGVGVSALLFAGYFFGGVPGLLQDNVGGTGISLIADLLMLAVGCGLTVLTIKAVAQKALHEMIGQFLPEKARKGLSPKTGKAGLYGLLITAALFFVLLEATVHINATDPSAWYEFMRGKFLP